MSNFRRDVFFFSSHLYRRVDCINSDYFATPGMETRQSAARIVSHCEGINAKALLYRRPSFVLAPLSTTEKKKNPKKSTTEKRARRFFIITLDGWRARNSLKLSTKESFKIKRLRLLTRRRIKKKLIPFENGGNEENHYFGHLFTTVS